MFTRTHPGFRFKENRLHIFSRDFIVLIDSWPDLKAVRKTSDHDRWTAFNPEFRLVRPYRRASRKKAPVSKPGQLEFGFGPAIERPKILPLATQRKKAFDGFRFSLPKTIASRLERFTNRQWRLLRLFEKEPRAVEVCSCNPALTFAIAHAEIFRSVRDSDTLDFAARYVLEKQKVLLGSLNYPDTPATVKVFRKLVPESISLESLKQLHSLLECDVSKKVLSHLPCINSGVLELLSLNAQFGKLPTQVYEEVASMASEKYRARIAEVVRENHFMLQQLERSGQSNHFRSVDRIRIMNTELTKEYCKMETVRRRNREFPKPPLPGTKSILPIESEIDLIKEGNLQHNCVASYTERVIDRRTYIYKLIRPQRCTLSVYQDHDGSWSVGELKQRFNQRPSPASFQKVTKWIQQFRIAV